MDLTHWITFSLDNYVFQAMGYEEYIFCSMFSDVNDPISWNISHTVNLKIWRKSIDETLKTLISTKNIFSLFFSLFLNLFAESSTQTSKNHWKTWIIITRVLDFTVKSFCVLQVFDVLIHQVQYLWVRHQECERVNPCSNNRYCSTSILKIFSYLHNW